MIHAIIQARVGSTRLPNKVFAIIEGRPLLQHIVDRLRYSKLLDDIIIATTANAPDDPIEDWSVTNNVKCFRGDEEDVLARYYYAAERFKSKTIVRITADDPFKDPAIMDSVIALYNKGNVDFACNNNPPSFPEGLDIEVFSFEAIKQAHCNATDKFEREHVTQYIYRNPNLFRTINLSCGEQLSHLRWTLDTIEDLEMVKVVYKHLYKPNSLFSFSDILKLTRDHPEITEINNKVKRSSLYCEKNR